MHRGLRECGSCRPGQGSQRVARTRARCERDPGPITTDAGDGHDGAPALRNTNNRGYGSPPPRGRRVIEFAKREIVIPACACRRISNVPWHIGK